MSTRQRKMARFRETLKEQRLTVPTFLFIDEAGDEFVPIEAASPAQVALAAGYRIDTALGVLDNAMVLMALLARGVGGSAGAKSSTTT